MIKYKKVVCEWIDGDYLVFYVPEKTTLKYLEEKLGAELCNEVK